MAHQTISSASCYTWVAIMEQAGAAAPTATVVHNDFNETFTFARTGAGVYTITSPGSKFTANKTVCWFMNGVVPNGVLEANPRAASTAIIDLHAHDLVTNLHADGVITACSVRIEVYL